MAGKFYELLGQFRLLSYGQLISRAVIELEKPEVAANVHAALQHLIVDEYQDVNPAQEPEQSRSSSTLAGRRSAASPAASVIRPMVSNVADRPLRHLASSGGGPPSPTASRTAVKWRSAPAGSAESSDA
jgi:hypothetical protein